MVCTATCLFHPGWEKEGRMTVVCVETIKFCHWGLEPRHFESLLVGCRDSRSTYREIADQVNDRIPASKVKVPGLPRLQEFSQSPSPDNYNNASSPVLAFWKSVSPQQNPAIQFFRIPWIFMLSTTISLVSKQLKTTYWVLGFQKLTTYPQITF